MAAGAKTRIADRDNLGEMARVVNGRLLVSSTGGGSGGDVNIAQVGGVAVTSLPVNDDGGSLTVDGLVAVSNFPATYPVTDNGGSLTVDGSVAVTNFPATYPVTDNGGSLTVDGTVAVSSVTPGVNALNLGKAEDARHSSGDTGVFVLGVRNDSGAGLVNANLDYAPFSIDSNGRLIVSPVSGDPSVFTSTVRVRDGTNSTKLMFVVQRGDTDATLGDPLGNVPMAVPGGDEDFKVVSGKYHNLTLDLTGRLRVQAGGYDAESIGKREDAPHTTADVGVFCLAVRRDSQSSGTNNDGDYASLNVDANGALWTRNTVMLQKLSSSTDGLPIQITGTATGSANTLHVTTANQYDRITIDLTNTGSTAIEVTIELGGTATGNQVITTVPGKATVRAVDKAVVGGSATTRNIKAFAGTGSVINAFGFVERNV